MYFNRELSWLEFNQRVVKESVNRSNPLGARLFFIGVFASNIDEFFMVRVGSLRDQYKLDDNILDITGLTPKEQLDLINSRSQKLFRKAYKYFEEVLEELKDFKFQIVKYEELDDTDRKSVCLYFKDEIVDTLSPIVKEASKGLPLYRNLNLNIFALLKDEFNDDFYGNIEIPTNLKRIIKIKGKDLYVTVEDVISNNLEKIFIGYKEIDATTFRIVRNADLSYDEEEAQDLLVKIEKILKERRRGQVIRLDILANTSSKILKIFKRDLEIFNNEIYKFKHLIDLKIANEIIKKKNLAIPKYKAYKGYRECLEDENIFSWISEKDRYCHVPYDDFEVISDFLKAAGNDKKVVAIKQTLYRVSKKSPIIDALEQASINGKSVTVLIELKARFDEKNNIHWTKRLEKAGVQVIHSPGILKTHSKMLQVIRREEEKYNAYCHISTGNYNEKTGKTYEDFSIFTKNIKISEDISKVFQALGNRTMPKNLETLQASPFMTRKFFKRMIHREIANVKRGFKGKIVCKMNSLTDKEVIDLVYLAGQNGVEVDLIIRGICALIPTKNIRVKSIIGRYLEHSRFYYFYNQGNDDLFMASMDWMERNFDRRLELIYPILDSDIKIYVMNYLDNLLKDNLKSHYLNNKGEYLKKKSKSDLDIQELYMKLERGRSQ